MTLRAFLDQARYLIALPFLAVLSLLALIIGAAIVLVLWLATSGD